MSHRGTSRTNLDSFLSPIVFGLELMGGTRRHDALLKTDATLGSIRTTIFKSIWNCVVFVDQIKDLGRKEIKGRLASAITFNILVEIGGNIGIVLTSMNAFVFFNILWFNDFTALFVGGVTTAMSDRTEESLLAVVLEGDLK